MKKELIEQIDLCKEVLCHNNDGILKLDERIKIWKLFGDHINRRDDTIRLNPPNYLPGHRRRLLLQKLCLEKVIPVWEKKMGSGTKVHDVLELIESYTKRGYPPIPPPKSNTAQQESLRLYIDNYQDEDNLVLIPCACLSLLSISICDQNDWIEPDAETIVDRLSPFGCHPDFYVSQFYSKNMSELQSYWRWYLNSAVPFAYESIEG